MKRAFLLLAIMLPMLFASACGSHNAQSQSHTPTVSIEAQFQPVVDSFIAEAQNQGASVTVTDLVIQSVPNLTGETMGLCQTDPTGATSPTIFISQASWDMLDSESQQELLFHELGHCVLNRVHNDTLNNGIAREHDERRVSGLHALQRE